MTTFRAIGLGVMLAVCAGTAAGRSQDRIPELQREAPKDSASETLTGCVSRGAVTGSYVLTNITRGKGDHNRIAGIAAEKPEPTSVALSGSDVDISRHVGHRVSVTGRYASASLFAPRGAIEDKPLAVEPAAPTGNKPLRTFRITSLAMLSDSCSHSAD